MKPEWFCAPRHGEAMVAACGASFARRTISRLFLSTKFKCERRRPRLDRYGKGIDPKARLNLSDCAAYALAKNMNSPLLFKGNDFAATDVRAVI